MPPAFHLAVALDVFDGLPHPRWEAVAGWVGTLPDADRPAAWTGVVRDWLGQLGAALGGGYAVAESDHFVALAAPDAGPPLLAFAERSRATLRATLEGVMNFDGRGKQPLVALHTRGDYYRYVGRHYPEGEFGASVGLHIRGDCPHVALYGRQLAGLELVLAHELTHVGLHHLDQPQWIEEGLAQLAEHAVLGRPLVDVTVELAARHKQFWREHGLAAFWTGAGFSRAGEVQELSYQLAEILLRLLSEDYRPRWFGWDQRPRQRFLDFLYEAKAADAGAAAAVAYLGMPLADVAGRFLGPGAG